MPSPGAMAAIRAQRDFFPGAVFGADFRAGRYKLGRRQHRHPTAIPGWSFTRASTGYAETSGGVLVPFASGAPRITDRGLLVEEARTNLLLRSQEFSGASWTVINMTVTPDAAVAPDGTTTADRVVPANGVSTGSCLLSQLHTKAASAITYTASIYAKPDGFDRLHIVCWDNGNSANQASVTVNISTGTVSTAAAVGGTFASPSVAVTAMAGGWYRVALTFTSGTETSLRTMYFSRSSSSGNGNGTGGAYWWGAQLEAGSFATSYIPTTTASATRAADAPVLSISQTVPLTAVVSAMPTAVSTAGSAIYMLLDDASASNRVRLYNDVSLPNARMLVTVGGVTQVSMANTAVVAGSRLKMAARAEVNNAGLSVNGGAVITDVSCTMPTPTRLTAADANAYIERWVVYPYAMTDAQLQGITT